MYTLQMCNDKDIPYHEIKDLPNISVAMAVAWEHFTHYGFRVQQLGFMVYNYEIFSKENYSIGFCHIFPNTPIEE